MAREVCVKSIFDRHRRIFNKLRVEALVEQPTAYHLIPSELSEKTAAAGMFYKKGDYFIHIIHQNLQKCF